MRLYYIDSGNMNCPVIVARWQPALVNMLEDTLSTQEESLNNTVNVLHSFDNKGVAVLTSLLDGFYRTRWAEEK